MVTRSQSPKHNAYTTPYWRRDFPLLPHSAPQTRTIKPYTMKKLHNVPTLYYRQKGDYLHFSVKYKGITSTTRTTGIKIEPNERWSAKTKTIEGSEVKTIDIREFETKLNTMYLKFKSLGRNITPKLLLDCICNQDHFTNEIPNLMGAIDSYIETQREEFENDKITAITFRRHAVRRRNVIEFLEAKYKTTNLLLDQVKPIIGKEYASFLRNTKKLGVSTVNKDLGCLKAVLSNAVLNEWVTHNVLSHWKRTREKTTIIFLTVNEVDTLKNLTITDPTLNSVRWIFIFGCYCGLSYKDLQLLKTDHLHTDSSGEFFIQKNRKKSDIKSTVSLSKTALEILARFHEHSTKTGFLLPTLSLDKYNQYLKALQSQAEISRLKLSSKISRNTFATVMINNGVPAEILKNATGHTNTYTTLKHYASVHESTTIEATKNALAKFDQ